MKTKNLEEIEFSKNGEGKIFVGIGCRKNKNNYQKILYLESVGDIDCKVGDQIHKNDNNGKLLAKLIFNRNESIDVLIEKLQKLKGINSKQTIESQREICDNPSCSCRLPLGC